MSLDVSLFPPSPTLTRVTRRTGRTNERHSIARRDADYVRRDDNLPLLAAPRQHLRRTVIRPSADRELDPRAHRARSAKVAQRGGISSRWTAASTRIAALCRIVTERSPGKLRHLRIYIYSLFFLHVIPITFYISYYGSNRTCVCNLWHDKSKRCAYSMPLYFV